MTNETDVTTRKEMSSIQNDWIPTAKTEKQGHVYIPFSPLLPHFFYLCGHACIYVTRTLIAIHTLLVMRVCETLLA